MEVIVLNPIGFCGGVERALKTAEKAKRERPNAPVYLLGRLVHNERVLRDLSDQGFITLDDREKPLEEWLGSLPSGSVFVYGAHGHSPKCEEIAHRKGLIAYDATCPFVKKNAEMIREAKEKGLAVAYIGQEGHMEAMSAIATAPDDAFIYHKGHIPEAFKGKEIVAICQTTMSKEDIDEAYRDLSAERPGARLIESRCQDATKRQEAARNMPGGIGALVVLGSLTSNNSRKLYEKARRDNPAIPVYLLQDGDTLPDSFPRGVKKVALMSGASTSNGAIKDAILYLESL